jgi:hypothetical protein
VAAIVAGAVVSGAQVCPALIIAFIPDVNDVVLLRVHGDHLLILGSRERVDLVVVDTRDLVLRRAIAIG